MSKNIAYHTRSIVDGKKLVGGTFGGSVDQETIERIVRSHFTVIYKPSGFPVFIDKEGREVNLYFSIDPGLTEAGKKAKEQFLKQKRIEQEGREKQREEIDDLLNEMSYEEILRKLKS